jgi:RNA polymerase sigma-70 factor (ECF subfamily)
VRELGRYRSFLRLQAMGVSPQFRSRVEASDIVQQTLLDAHEKLDQFRGSSEGEMAKWLSQILSNNITDAIRALRRQKRDVARELPLQGGPQESFQSPAERIAADQTSPSLCVHRAEQAFQLSEAIQSLPLPQQEVIVLHHLQGRSLAEVAASMDRSQSAVAGLLYRGLKSLRKSLAS